MATRPASKKMQALQADSKDTTPPMTNQIKQGEEFKLFNIDGKNSGVVPSNLNSQKTDKETDAR